MSRYDPLWEHIRTEGSVTLLLSFEQIKEILGSPVDHSFLNHKKELLSYGYEVKKISLKQETILFQKIT